MWKVDESVCIGCGACVNVCPVNIIKMKDVKGEMKSSVAKEDQSKCIKCMTCVNTCPVQAIKVE